MEETPIGCRQARLIGTLSVAGKNRAFVSLRRPLCESWAASEW